jgi:hypothetical protein
VIGSSRIVHRAQRQTAPGWPEVTKVPSGMHKGTERERIACRKTLASWFPLSFPLRQCLSHMESTRFWPFRTKDRLASGIICFPLSHCPVSRISLCVPEGTFVSSGRFDAQDRRQNRPGDASLHQLARPRRRGRHTQWSVAIG